MRPVGGRRARHGGVFGEINVTPLIDVVMCLIIFYLMVGRLALQKRAEVQLPRSAIGAQAEPTVLVVNVLAHGGEPAGTPAPGAGPFATGQVIVESEPVGDEQALESLVRERLLADPQTVVQIRAAQDLNFGVVSPVMRACTRGGAMNVRLATQRVGPPAEGGGR
jgi:biopolymer transport protein ExbD